jgi:DNA-binding CsgD family transcriptional regulator
MSPTVKSAKKPILVLGEDEEWPPLTREVILAACREGVCPFCDRDSLVAVGTHLGFGHGVSADQVREHYGFKYSQSFATPEYSARRSAANRQLLAESPDHRARFADARRRAGPATRKRRPQTIERLRQRGPEYGAALLAYRKANPEQMLAYEHKAIAAAQARYRELCSDQDWLDQKMRRFPLAQRKQIVRRFNQGATLAELGRAYDASPTSISELLARQGIRGEDSRRQSYRHYRFTAAQEEEIVRRRTAGETAAALASEFDCVTSFIYYLVRHRQRQLTARELELLRLFSTPASLEQIAAQSGISAKTVGWHRTIIYRKLGVRSRAEAVRRAVELHLIEESG